MSERNDRNVDLCLVEEVAVWKHAAAKFPSTNTKGMAEMPTCSACGTGMVLQSENFGRRDWVCPNSCTYRGSNGVPIVHSELTAKGKATLGIIAKVAVPLTIVGGPVGAAIAVAATAASFAIANEMDEEAKRRRKREESR